MAIIAILASLLMPAVLRAYTKARGMADELEAPEVADLLLKNTRDYCAAHPRYSFASKSDLADKCVLAPKCRSWVQAPTTEFTPFTYLDLTNKVVLCFHIGSRRAAHYVLTKGDLSIRPER